MGPLSRRCWGTATRWFRARPPVARCQRTSIRSRRQAPSGSAPGCRGTARRGGPSCVAPPTSTSGSAPGGARARSEEPDDFVRRRLPAADPIPQVARRIESIVRESHPFVSSHFVAGSFGADPAACRKQSVRSGGANPRLSRCRGARVCSRQTRTRVPWIGHVHCPSRRGARRRSPLSLARSLRRLGHAARRPPAVPALCAPPESQICAEPERTYL